METTKLTLKQKLVHEIRRILVIVSYLWVVFSLFAIYDAVMTPHTRGTGIALGLALINALALAKVIVVAEHFGLGERFKDSPLLYTTVFKSIVYAIILGCFKIIEASVVGFFRGHTLEQSIDEIGGGSLKSILVLVALLAVILMPFFAFGELDRAVGKGKIATLFLKSRYSLEDSGVPTV